jgi:Na+:H+ antiporter, NhaC family
MNQNGPSELVIDSETIRSIPIWKAWVPIVVLIGLLFYNVVLFADNATYGPNQIALLMAAAVAVIIGKTLGFHFPAMLHGVKSSIYSALTAMMILLLIGSLIGTWVISGVVPAMIYYGLEILDAKIFLAASVVVCSIVSVATGSSWSTVGTVGIALAGIGHALGVSPGYTAGAVISGAYFGDKISPLSDTTNLAAAMAGTDLITHVRYMLITTVPSILITLGIFFWMGYSSTEVPSIAQIEALQTELKSHFNMSPLLFLIPAAVLVMVALRIDPLVALFIGTLLGGLFAVAFQQKVILKLAGVETATVSNVTSEISEPSKVGVLKYCQYSYEVVMNAMVDKKLVRIVPEADVEAWKAELGQKRLDMARAQFKKSDLTKLDQLSSTEKASILTSPEMVELNAKIAAAGLIEGKGMIGMLNTIWLIICAMFFGGVMEACGLLQRIAMSLLSFANSTASLIATTAGSCLFVNLTASDQYLAIVVPGRMFRKAFQDRGLAPQNLSRTLEDAGTVTSPLVPWNTCGAFQSSTLDIATLVYAPYCFFNWISPLMTMLFAALNIRIARMPETEMVSEQV